MAISKSGLLSFAKQVFRSLGLEVSVAARADTQENVLRWLLASHPSHFVIDVGANSGQYGRLLRRLGYSGPIVSFEPLKAAHDRLTRLAAADPAWTVAPRAALGARPARTTINVASNSVSSSLLEMKRAHLEVEPLSAFSGTEEVEILALDDCLDGFVGPGTGGLLKIDTQGYEIEVLRGAERSLLDRFDVVQTELSLVELYAGQPLMLDVCNLLSRSRFNLRQIIPGLKDPVSGKLLQLDGIFVRD